MKRFMVFLILLVLVVSLAVSFTDSASGGRIVGVWKLVSIYEGFSGEILPAESTGHSEKIEFDIYGRVAQYVDDRVILSGIYTASEGSIVIHWYYWWLSGRPYFAFERKFYYSFENNTLQLETTITADGGAGMTYRRELSFDPHNMAMEEDWLL